MVEREGTDALRADIIAERLENVLPLCLQAVDFQAPSVPKLARLLDAVTPDDLIEALVHGGIVAVIIAAEELDLDDIVFRYFKRIMPSSENAKQHGQR
jgi:hypothetical protein